MSQGSVEYQFSGDLPEAKQPQVVAVYDDIVMRGGQVFRNVTWQHSVFDAETERTVDLPKPLSLIRVGVVATEYLNLHRIGHNKLRRDGDWGEGEADYQDMMSRGPGETGVSVVGPRSHELSLAKRVREKWIKKMAKFESQTFWGELSLKDGFGELEPRDAARGPWTVRISNGQGSVFERTYRRGLGGLVIKPSVSRYI